MMDQTKPPLFYKPNFHPTYIEVWPLKEHYYIPPFALSVLFEYQFSRDSYYENLPLDKNIFLLQELLDCAFLSAHPNDCAQATGPHPEIHPQQLCCL